MSTWSRGRSSAVLASTAFTVSMGTIPLGGTMLRMHTAWEVTHAGPTYVDVPSILGFHYTAGIYTTSLAAPQILDPATSPSDVAPPDQRWLYYEQVSLLPWPHVLAAGLGSTIWQAKPAVGQLDIKAPVKASTQALEIILAITPNVPLPEGWVAELSFWYSRLEA